jgi:hypothetical protein
MAQVKIELKEITVRLVDWLVGVSNAGVITIVIFALGILGLCFRIIKIKIKKY